MKRYAGYFVVSLLLVLMSAFAQTTPTADGNPAFTQQELDQMLAPIALYPDSLLSQVLMAATYPLEVVQAARWSSANSTINGTAAVEAVDNQDWDPSVKSLLAFPQVLQTLDQKIDWTERLGDAFIAQQAQVMDTVQMLRQKAKAAGNLNSNAQIAVTQSNDSIDVAPANPNEVYVPYFDPTIAYGTWWWPQYPPVFWAPWDGYGWSGGFAWGIGVGIGADFFIGSWDWRNHRIYARGRGYLGGGHSWQHDPGHRRGVPYRNASLNRQFGRASAPSSSRDQFRGHASSSKARAAETGSRPAAEPIVRSQRNVPEMHGNGTPANDGHRSGQPRPHAFENIGRGADTRGFSARGHASAPARSNAPAPSRGASRPSHH
jgi:hypothetical protein